MDKKKNVCQLFFHEDSIYEIPATSSKFGGITSLKCLNLQMAITPETRSPVNAHLTPGPAIYFNAFIHVYSPNAGADNPLWTKF